MPKVYGFTGYGGSEVQEFWDQPKPDPGPGELLVAVRAAGVNPADWKIRQGHLKDQLHLEVPAVLGGEAAGVVEAVGQDVEGFAVGDEVLGTTAPNSGGYAEYTLLTAHEAAKKPPHVSFVDAAALPVAAATAFDAVRQLDLVPGSTLFINGIGGGVGVAAAQIARDSGLSVIGTGGDGKQDLVESLGAVFVDHRTDVVGAVRRIRPDGVDAVLDLVGGESLRTVADLAGDRGKVLSAADPRTAQEVGGGPVRRSRTGSVLAEVVRLVADGKLDPHAVDVRPLDEAGEALRAVESGHARGKVVIQVP